ncbi:hypothetical protein FACS1894180_8470 [Bacteroidia bacterium]|nr:hypothetical protein FACS1894180_8470 [Bacteroidia bacterium]
MQHTENQVISAFDIEEKALLEFYAQTFENRMKFLPKIWRWLNRSDFYQNRVPLVIQKDGKVIAHTGLTAGYIYLNGKVQTAAWMMDYMILKQFQRQGLGSELSKSLVSFSDCSLGLPNEKSLGTLKKNGWKQYPYSFQIFNFMHLFNHPAFAKKLPAFVRKVLNFIAVPILFVFYKWNACSKKAYKLEKLTDENFAEFYNIYKKSNTEIPTATTPVRDENFAEWRILQSPNRDKYFVYFAENFSAVLLIHNNHGQYIDVLWVSDNRNRRAIKKMLATLGVYGLKHKIACLRLYSNDNELAAFLKKNMLAKIKRTNLVYFSTNKEIFEKMENNAFDFQLLDSDMEHIR